MGKMMKTTAIVALVVGLGSSVLGGCVPSYTRGDESWYMQSEESAYYEASKPILAKGMQAGGQGAREVCWELQEYEKRMPVHFERATMIRDWMEEDRKPICWAGYEWYMSFTPAARRLIDCAGKCKQRPRMQPTVHVEQEGVSIENVDPGQDTVTSR